MRFGRNIWSSGQKLPQSIWIAPLGPLADIGIGIRHGNALGQNGGYKMVDGNPLLTGQDFNPAADGLRN